MRARPSLLAPTIDAYVSTVRARFAELLGWSFVRSAAWSSFMRRLKAVKRDRNYREPASRRLVEAVAGDASLPLAVRCAVVVAWDGLLRASEYLAGSDWRVAAEYSLMTGDVIATKFGDVDGYRLRIKSAKQDRYNLGEWQPFVPRPSDPVCPVTWLTSYMRSALFLQVASQGSVAGHLSPFFVVAVRVSRHAPEGWRCVSREDVSNALKKHAAMCGVAAELVSSHSLRIGGAFALAEGGVPLEDIQQRGRWSQRRTNEIALMYARVGSAKLLRLSAAMNSQSVPAALYRNGK